MVQGKRAVLALYGVERVHAHLLGGDGCQQRLDLAAAVLGVAHLGEVL